jgi:hypothetical protein
MVSGADFFAGIQRICLETSYCRDTVGRVLSELCRAGWLVALGGNRSEARTGGHFKANGYRVVQHGDWAAGHVGVCEAISRNGEHRSRKNSVTEKFDSSVTEKSEIPVTEKPPHIIRDREQVEDRKGLSLFEPGISNQKRPPKPEPSAAGLCLAERLGQLILQNCPTAKVTTAQVQNWAHEAELMLRRDGRTEKEIAEVMQWSQADGFWQTNILSMGKLREKFDQLTLKMRRDNNGNRIQQRRDERVAAAARGLIGPAAEDTT